MALTPGDRVDRYEIVARLGKGGMGEVYRARDPKLDRPIALKILHADGTLPEDARRRLLREARAVAKLSHPNVLAVFDAGEVEEPARLRGIPYIAMELVVGTTLRTHIGSNHVPIARRIDWLRDVARALAAAHGAGVVHRDVKPENVMIRFDGVVKVLDFGIARRVAGARNEGLSTGAHSLPTLRGEDARPPPGALPTSGTDDSRAGTLEYMAPEQLRGEAIDGRTDQFAWGVTAYELLSGERPWTRGDPIQIVSQILSTSPRPLAGVAPVVPRHIAEVVERALSRDPSARFPTMDAVLAGLAREAPTNRVGVLALGAVAAAAAVGIAATVVVRAREAPAGAAPIAAAPGCVSSAACAREHGDGAWRCQSTTHECVEIASPDCTPLAQPGDFLDDDTVWVGALYPTTGEAALNYAGERRALELAREDFASALAPRRGHKGALGARPIGVVLCDEEGDASRAAEHLVHAVEVPAVVGFSRTRTALSTIPSIFLPANVLSFIAITQAPEVIHIPEPSDQARLVWRSTLDATDIVPPLAAFVSDVLEPRLRAERARPASESIRVAFLRRSGGTRDIPDLLLRALHFNGKSAIDNGDDLRQFVFDEDGDGPAEDAVAGLLAFRPDIVFVTGLTFVRRVLVPLEARWDGTLKPGAAQSTRRDARPIYVLPTGGFTTDAAAFVGTSAERRHRFFGATNAATRATNAELVLRYNLAFPKEPVSRTTAPQPSYDAFYVLAYAIAALGDGSVTGPAIAGAIPRLLPPGRPIDVGPAAILEGFGILRAGKIDLNGAIGALDFDATTGEAPIDYSIVCFGVDDRGSASDTIDSSFTYRAATGKFEGTLRCP